METASHGAGSLWRFLMCVHDHMYLMESFFGGAQSQVLVLAHVAPDVEPLCPVIAYRLRPAPVVAVFSRTAKLEPRCQPKHAVWHTWKAANSSCVSAESGTESVSFGRFAEGPGSLGSG